MAAADVELLTGARRCLRAIRGQSKRLAEARLLVGGVVARGGGPAFLFATSAGEVGVDLDAEHMVSDLVAWERMVQRLGRVNRRGGKGPRRTGPSRRLPSDKAHRRRSAARWKPRRRADGRCLAWKTGRDRAEWEPERGSTRSGAEGEPIPSFVESLPDGDDERPRPVAGLTDGLRVVDDLAA